MIKRHDESEFFSSWYLFLERLTVIHFSPAKTFDILPEIFNESSVGLHRLGEPRICRFCHAKLFHGEKNTFCCSNGKKCSIEGPNRFPLIQFESGLQRDLFKKETVQSSLFHDKIRLFNQAVALSSVGFDFQRVTNLYGNRLFAINGHIYHSIQESVMNRTLYFQALFYDPKFQAKYFGREIGLTSGRERKLLRKIIGSLRKKKHFDEKLTTYLGFFICPVKICSIYLTCQSASQF